MTRKQKRLMMLCAGLAVLAVAAGLVLYAMRDNIVFFYTPSDITEKAIPPAHASDWVGWWSRAASRRAKERS